MKIKKIKNNKGVSHVEFIISFVIFVGFVIFLFFIFNPLKKTADTSIVDSLYLNLEENLTSVLSSISVSFNLNYTGRAPDCLKINNIPDLQCGDEKNLIVKDVNKNIIPSKFNGNDINFNYNPSIDFYTFYCSEEIPYMPDDLTGCYEVSEEEETLSVIRYRNLWSQKRLEALRDLYNIDYDNVKSRFVSQGNDFGFVITDLDGNSELNATILRPPRANVFAKTLPIDVIDSNADITKKTITVITW